MATRLKTPQTVEVCPWCGAPGRTAWGTCLACGRYYLAKGWANTPRSRHPFRWIFICLGVVAVLFLWIIHPFLPDPVTLLFKQPSTTLSSNAPSPHWAMSGMDTQQRRYVEDAARQPEGRL